MKLYFAPHACSMNPHIVLAELGLPYELIKVDTKTKKMSNGGDFYDVSPKGYVPALELDNGEILTEGPVIVQYLADLKPEADIAPKNGTMERVRMQEWLHYIGTELHGSAGPLFNPTMPAEVKEIFKKKLINRIGFIEPVLEKQDYLVGGKFTPADGYLFVVLGWLKYFDIDVKQWPAIARFVERVAKIPAVQKAIQEEDNFK
ncbi:glutathione transferase GstA [Microvirga sp. W0021]|uniref:Glutathione transferase GstA n=1 Tax=Hohaiivirga grylli TaxID=3133970 RepID=A0ABV0BI07_9HYPH